MLASISLMIAAASSGASRYLRHSLRRLAAFAKRPWVPQAMARCRRSSAIAGAGVRSYAGDRHQPCPGAKAAWLVAAAVDETAEGDAVAINRVLEPTRSNSLRGPRQGDLNVGLRHEGTQKSSSSGWGERAWRRSRSLASRSPSSSLPGSASAPRRSTMP